MRFAKKTARKVAAVEATSKRVGLVGRRQMSAASVTNRAATLSDLSVSKITSVNPTPTSPSRIALKRDKRSLSSGSMTILFGALAACLDWPQRSNELSDSAYDLANPKHRSRRFPNSDKARENYSRCRL